MNNHVKALKPCPHCGKAEYTKVANFQFPPDDEGEAWEWGFHVVCSAAGLDIVQRGCGASSGWGETPDEAIAAWNRRAALEPESGGEARPQPHHPGRWLGPDDGLSYPSKEAAEAALASPAHKVTEADVERVAREAARDAVERLFQYGEPEHDYRNAGTLFRFKDGHYFFFADTVKAAILAALSAKEGR